MLEHLASSFIHAKAFSNIGLLLSNSIRCCSKPGDLFPFMFPIVLSISASSVTYSTLSSEGFGIKNWRKHLECITEGNSHSQELLTRIRSVAAAYKINFLLLLLVHNFSHPFLKGAFVSNIEQDCNGQSHSVMQHRRKLSAHHVYVNHQLPTRSNLIHWYLVCSFLWFGDGSPDSTTGHKFPIIKALSTITLSLILTSHFDI